MPRRSTKCAGGPTALGLPSSGFGSASHEILVRLHSDFRFRFGLGTFLHRHPSPEHRGSEGCRAVARSAQAGRPRWVYQAPASAWQAKPLMQQFWYVYILESELGADHFYVGLTEDLKARLHKHNAGEVPHTSKFKPWRIKTAIAFTDQTRATAFERSNLRNQRCSRNRSLPSIM